MMAVGWSRDGDVQEQMDATVKSAVETARSRLSNGQGLTHCEECGDLIPEARRNAVSGVRLCVKCQAELEKEMKNTPLFNRSASKGSQLR
jgi:phage/conjugal plasmid C-4 type zinc finger TraR family protein